MYESAFAEISRHPQIAAILSRRFNELVDSKNGHDAYFTAMMLHPGM